MSDNTTMVLIVAALVITGGAVVVAGIRAVVEVIRVRHEKKSDRRMG